ncbi:MAG: hypothetical protein LBS44_02000 [Deltaproteobacteria bacterium]|nr:hypothetical protein [Deltaproteobacteria bacterium]
MNSVQSKPNQAYFPLQVAATIRSTSVGVNNPSPNVVDQIITSGSPKPQATVSNPMVTTVDSFSPLPGRNMAHYLALDVDKAGKENTTVSDALQRYLDISPTRKPGGDPKDVDSHDSYPTLIMDEDKAWEEILPYKFSVNGVVQRQAQPVFYAMAGSLKLRLVGRGVSTVTTPATEPSPTIPSGPIPALSYYPPEVAAQLTMRRITDLMSDSNSGPDIKVGPELTNSPDEAVTNAANIMAILNVEPAGPTISEKVKEGLTNFANMGIYKSRPQLYLSALAARA